jgi:hypothetical protein
MKKFQVSPSALFLCQRGTIWYCAGLENKKSLFLFLKTSFQEILFPLDIPVQIRALASFLIKN